MSLCTAGLLRVHQRNFIIDNTEQTRPPSPDEALSSPRLLHRVVSKRTPTMAMSQLRTATPSIAVVIFVSANLSVVKRIDKGVDTPNNKTATPRTASPSNQRLKAHHPKYSSDGDTCDGPVKRLRNCCRRVKPSPGQRSCNVVLSAMNVCSSCSSTLTKPSAWQFFVMKSVPQLGLRCMSLSRWN